MVKLFEADNPLVVPIWPNDPGKLCIAIGDAHVDGFGAGTQYPDLVSEERDGLWLELFAAGVGV